MDTSLDKIFEEALRQWANFDLVDLVRTEMEEYVDVEYSPQVLGAHKPFWRQLAAKAGVTVSFFGDEDFIPEVRQRSAFFNPIYNIGDRDCRVEGSIMSVRLFDWMVRVSTNPLYERAAGQYEPATTYEGVWYMGEGKFRLQEIDILQSVSKELGVPYTLPGAKEEVEEIMIGPAPDHTTLKKFIRLALQARNKLDLEEEAEGSNHLDS